MKRESNDELKEIGIKNRMFYYFDDVIKIQDTEFDNILIVKISWFMSLRTKLNWGKTIALLDSIYMDLLEFMTEIDI